MKKAPISIIIVLAFLFLSCSKDSKTIRIGHKNFTEQRITGNILSVYLESKGYKTKMNELAGTMLNHNALKNKNIDIYCEYTGTAYGAIYGETKVLSPEKTYNYVKKIAMEEDKIMWLKPLGWNNTYVLSIKPELAKKHNIVNISDLAKISNDLILGSNSEFLNRSDGLLGLKEAYDITFKSEKDMDQGLTYIALDKGDIDVNSSFSTDGRIAKFGFVNLDDDKGFFPPYYITPVVHNDFAESNPEIIAAISDLEDKWTESELQKYNLMVDEGAEVKEIATKMLKEKGLIK